MARKSLLKRAVSSFTAAAIAVVAMPVIPAFAETGASTFSFDGYDVEYSVKNEWTDGKTIEVKITNTGDEPILNWAFKYNAEGKVNDLWNASVYNSDNTSYIIKNNGWNYEIAPAASVLFGYKLTDFSENSPNSFVLCSKRVDKTEGYDVQYNITKEWNDGLQGEIVISNTSEEPLEAWELSFDSTFAINNLWNGKIISSEDNHYVVASEMWSNPIDVGGSKTIGFTGKKQDANDVALSNFSLSVVIIDEDGNSGDTGGNAGNDDPNPNPDIDVTTDTDSDQIPDAYEEIFGTDKNDPDTDDDGLTDYEEIALTGTDPLVYDSVTEGISDADADCDEDGLTNKEELTLGTSPTSADTDFDGLSDYDEINVYNTDPLNPDTDGDGISDGDEIKLGTDPTSDTTDGIKDTERVTHQIISSDSDIFSYLNDEDNPLKISVEIDAAGLAESSLSVDKSRYYHAIENSAVVGVIPEFEYADGLKVENMTIKFEVDETARANKIGSYAKECAELEGIKRLNVFEYFDDIGVLLPIETHHDVENNIVYAETSELGTYCVLDMEIWFKNLGIDPIASDESTEVSHIDLAFNSSASLSDETSDTNAKSSRSEKVDLALCLDTRTCVSSTEFSMMKQAIKYIVNLSYDNKLNVGDISIYYQDKSGYHRKGITQSNLSDLDSITRSIDLFYYDSNNTKVYYNDLTAMLEYTYNNISERETVIFFITNRDGVVVQTQLVDKMKNIAAANADKAHVVIIGDKMYAENGIYYQMFVKSTNGLMMSGLDEYTVGDVLQTYLEPTSYKILLANKFEEVELKGMLRKASDIDSDDDGKSDWDEIDFDVVNKFKSNPSRTYCFNSQFPINQDFVNYESSHQPKVLVALDSVEPYKETVMMKAAAPVKTDPTLPDSDFDGIDDSRDISNSNIFSAQITNNDVTFSVSYTMDLSNFFKSNSIYNNDLSTVSSIASCVMYGETDYNPDFSPYNDGSTSYMDEDHTIESFLSYHGFTDLKYYSLSLDPQINDQHITDIAFGHKCVVYNGEDKEIIAIIIRGTDDSIKEWSSNFEIGSSEMFESGEYSEWVIKDNHKGFDISATRVIKYVDYYLKNDVKELNSKNIALWITGHSRGGGISNIVGARIIDDLNKINNFYLNGSYRKDRENIYVYTFASPNTTTINETYASSLNYIHNVINTDDIVTCLPLGKIDEKNNTWGFIRYGKDEKFSVNNTCKRAWENNTNVSYASNVSKMNGILLEFYDLSKTRDDCYKFTCTCHGDGSDTSICYNSDILESYIYYGKEYQKSEIVGLSFRHCETTAYFMQYLATLTAVSGKPVFLIAYLYEGVAPKYKRILFDFALYAGVNLKMPHLSASYYMISGMSEL